MKRRLCSKLLILNDRREVDVAVVALPIDFLVKGGLLIVPHVEMTLAYLSQQAVIRNKVQRDCFFSSRTLPSLPPHPITSYIRPSCLTPISTQRLLTPSDCSQVSSSQISPHLEFGGAQPDYLEAQ
jgi:hypothetical protein